MFMSYIISKYIESLWEENTSIWSRLKQKVKEKFAITTGLKTWIDMFPQL